MRIMKGDNFHEDAGGTRVNYCGGCCDYVTMIERA